MPISIISPNENSIVKTGTPIEILAILQSETKVRRVDFYIDDTKIGESISHPYHAFYNPDATGSITIKAIALLQNSQIIESPLVNITVIESSNLQEVNFPPIIQLFNPATLNAGQTVTLTAKGSDDGTITKVEFYVNSVKLGEASSSPYTVNWTPKAGDYTLTAIAYDDKGDFTTSDPVKINVGNNPPSVLSVVNVTEGDTVNSSNWLLL